MMAPVASTQTGKATAASQALRPVTQSRAAAAAVAAAAAAQATNISTLNQSV